MPTPSQIDEEFLFERKLIDGGLEKFRKDTLKLEKASYASATVYGSSSIENLLPIFIKYIKEKTAKRLKNASGHRLHLLHNFILQIDPESAAAIASKIVFDKVFSYRKEESAVCKITESCGRAIEAELQMRYYEQIKPGLFNALKKSYWHMSKGTESKRKSMQVLMQKQDIDPWVAWTPATRVKVGGWYVDALCESSGWFEVLPFYTRNRTENRLVPTEQFIKHKDEIVKIAELFSPFSWPMLIEPNDWTPTNEGGYLLNQLTRCHDFVRKGQPLPVQGKLIYEFINAIQKVKYTLNPWIVEVAETLEQLQRGVGKFRPIMYTEIPPKPADIDTNAESKKRWKRDATKINNANAQEFRKSCRTRMTMNFVKEFKNKPYYYLCFSCDYRGRIYPIPTVGSTQDTDFGKALVRAGDESPVTPDAITWIKFEVATCYGLDKSPMQERLDWTSNNHDLIEKVATDPIGCLPTWEVAEEPFRFLAAAREYYEIVIAKTRTTTGLWISIDATSSGLQLLAGMSSDLSTAKLTNCVPSDRPQDAYKVVAEAAKPHIPQRFWKVWDRKNVKRIVMTLPYSAKFQSNLTYIREGLVEKGIEPTTEEVTQTVRAVRQAMSDIFPGPMKTMAWIEKEVAKAIKRGMTEISWITPSGFRVVQRLMKKDTETVELKLLGRCRVKVGTGELGVDLNHHKNATSPNFIHSLDSSMLALACTKAKGVDVSLIHDCILAKATDMTLMSKLIREAYKEIFTNHNVLKDFAKAINAEEEPPYIGDLDPSLVTESTYFFC